MYDKTLVHGILLHAFSQLHLNNQRLIDNYLFYTKNLSRHRNYQ